MAAEHVPGGVRASWLVVDADTAEVLRRHGERHRYRSASLVKPLIALDHLRRGGEPSAAERALLEPMLRSSDDDAASELWDRGGRERIVHRTVAEIGLTGTEPPRDPDMWGYVVLTAADVVLALRHLRTAGSAGEFVLAQLRRFTRHGTDGFDQTFGLPAAGAEVDALKQGWSGFGLGPNETPPEPAAERRRIPDERIDLEHPAMHTSGLVRRGDRLLIVAVCTLHPVGTGWDTAAETITGLTRSLLD
ncbi:hypothetical protein ABZ805_16115 [Saccharopolyspora sp. NPDC047091]|uniref:hypothetical protein n=1 Tax=Saccharopolyspora sp. NPDC047091 TaxID=3155924 RepID=UPI00340BCB0F